MNPLGVVATGILIGVVVMRVFDIWSMEKYWREKLSLELRERRLEQIRGDMKERLEISELALESWTKWHDGHLKGLRTAERVVRGDKP